MHLSESADGSYNGTKRKRKSGSLAAKPSTAKRRKVQKSRDTTHHDCEAEEDVFIKKIHARPINGIYVLLHKLGEGGFGAVYLGRNLVDGREVALKLEHRSRVPSILEEEAEKCKEFSDVPGFPSIYWFSWHDDYKVMAFELLGPSLEDLFVFCDHRFSLKTTLMILDQLLQRLEKLHFRGLLHRDIKPANCLLGSGSNGNVVYITDFGLAQDAEPDDGCAETSPVKSRLIGTARYAIIRGHEGRTQSFKDDLESLGYMSIHFMRGKLPWQGLKGPSKEKAALVMEKKKSMSIEELCEGLPEEFAEYVRCVRRLQHGEIPDYARMRRLFCHLAKKEGLKYDNVFDWTILVYRQQEDQKVHGRARFGSSDATKRL